MTEVNANAERAELMSLLEASRYTGLCVRTIRGYIAAGRLTGYRLGPRAIRVHRAELESMLRPIPTVERSDAA